MDYPLQIPPKRNALRLFFSLVFILSWPLWMLSALARAGMLAFPFPATLGDLIGAWVPSLLGIFITLAVDKRRAVRLLLRRMLVWRVGLGWYIFALFWPALLSVLFHTAQVVTNLFLASSAYPWVSPALTLLLVVWIVFRYDAIHLTRLPTAVSRDTLTG
jgi:hypothetical protein